MESREKILSAIAHAGMQKQTLERMPVFHEVETKLSETFKISVEKNGGYVYSVETSSEAFKLIPSFFNGELFAKIASAANWSEWENKTNEELGSLDLCIIKGEQAVAENGAVWVSSLSLPDSLRSLPFISQHLVLIVNQKNIVATMHQGYREINSGNYMYGVWIAGPSKTADIEQSLVIGAHGPRSLNVFLVNE